MKKGKASKNFKRKGLKVSQKSKIRKQNGYRAELYKKKINPSQIKRSWQKDTSAQSDNKGVKKDPKAERKNNDNLMRIIIMEYIKAEEPNVERIKESLSKMSSRGLKQRTKKKVVAAGITIQ